MSSSFLTIVARQAWLSISRVRTYLSNFFLLSCSSISPSMTDLQSEVESALTLGANDTIASLFAFVLWHAGERCG